MPHLAEKKQIDDFEAHYQYDSTYMREMLAHTPKAYAMFVHVLPLANYREILEPDAYWVAKLAALQVEDCGDCLQLNVRMALEADVTKQIVEAVIDGGDKLPQNLHDVYAYATQVADQVTPDVRLMTRIEAQYSKGALMEFGLCIATAKLFPSIKRALGYTKSCSLIKLEV